MVRKAPCELDEDGEVAPGIGADRDDVVDERRRRIGAEVVDVDAEGDELDARAGISEPRPQLLDLAPPVRDDRVEPAERLREELLRTTAAQLLEPLGQSDRDVDDRWPHTPEPAEQRERDPHGVDRREDDVREVGLVARPQYAREEARVPPSERGGPAEKA